MNTFTLELAACHTLLNNRNAGPERTAPSLKRVVTISINDVTRNELTDAVYGRYARTVHEFDQQSDNNKNKNTDIYLAKQH